jgi:acyl carrier protein
MIPAMFVGIDALPLTANGKPDRAALPEPCAANLLRDIAFRAPEGASEQRLAEIMSGLLGIDAIGADDNFFLMGGHSLLGSQLVLRARSAFEIDLALRDVFETRTVSRLAERVEKLAIEKLARMSEEDAQRLVARQ